MEIRYYSIESLEDELRALEERYGLSSEEFYGIYCADEDSSGVPGVDGFRWADTYLEVARLRALTELQPA